LCLDDSHLATPQVVSRSLYQIANGVGRGRGAPHGLRPSKSCRRWEYRLGSSR
jgi:hypothetical protein